MLQATTRNVKTIKIDSDQDMPLDVDTQISKPLDTHETREEFSQVLNMNCFETKHIHCELHTLRQELKIERLEVDKIRQDMNKIQQDLLDLQEYWFLEDLFDIQFSVLLKYWRSKKRLQTWKRVSKWFKSFQEWAKKQDSNLDLISNPTIRMKILLFKLIQFFESRGKYIWLSDLLESPPLWNIKTKAAKLIAKCDQLFSTLIKSKLWTQNDCNDITLFLHLVVDKSFKIC
jgi:hypothetical protein